MRRKIRLIEGNAICRHLVFAAGVYLSEAQNHIIPPPLHTLYSVLIHRGREEGRVEPERRVEGNRGAYRYQSWVKNTSMTECPQKTGYLQSINSDKHLPQSPITGQFVR
jgi:hypothetical protein